MRFLDASTYPRCYLLVGLFAGDHAIGSKPDSLQRRAQINIIALRRNGVSCDDPVVDLESGDVIVVEDHPDDIQAEEIEIMAGL